MKPIPKTTLNLSIKIFGLFIVLTALGSCAKDTECDPKNEQSPCYSGLVGHGALLLQEEKINGQTDLSFEYNDQNQVSAYHIHPKDGNGMHTALFTYNAKGLMIAAIHSQDGKHLYREDYSYGSGDKLISGVWTYEDQTITVQYSHSQHTITEIAFSPNGEQASLNTYTFDAKDENILKMELTLGGQVQSTHEYADYDDKVYRYTNYPWQWKVPSSNNATSYKLSVLGSQVALLDHRWNYTYNQAGYPTKAEVYDRKTNALVETREFTYIPTK